MNGGKILGSAVLLCAAIIGTGFIIGLILDRIAENTAPDPDSNKPYLDAMAQMLVDHRAEMKKDAQERAEIKKALAERIQ